MVMPFASTRDAHDGTTRDPLDSTSSTRPTRPAQPPERSSLASSATTESPAASASVDHDDEVELGFSFSGGGWLMVYMFGVAKALRACGAHKNARFIGSSAGSLAAMGLLLDSDFDAITEVALSQYVPLARASLRGATKMRDYLHLAMLAVGNVGAWAKTKTHPRGCRIVYTSISAFKSRRKSTFQSQDDMVACLLASCTATPIAGFPFKYDGEWVMDGGLSDHQPLFTKDDGVKRTIKVTPNVFDSSADIKPSKYIPPCWVMYAPTPDDLRWVYRLGFEDGLAWCRGNGFKIPPTTTGPRTEYAHRATSPGTESEPVITQFKTVLGQLTGYQLVEDLASHFTCTRTLSIHRLLWIEIFLWKLLAICLASLDRVTMVFSSLMATAVVVVLLAHGSLQALLGLECVVLGTLYLVVCGSRVHHKTRQVMSSAAWQRIDASLHELYHHSTSSSSNTVEESGSDETHGMKEIQRHHGKLHDHHHAALAENSILYRIATLLHI